MADIVLPAIGSKNWAEPLVNAVDAVNNEQETGRLSETALSTTFVAGAVSGTEGTVGLGTLWRDMQVSSSALDRFVVIENAAGEGNWIQEPQLWVHGDTLNMLYTASGGIRYASCSVADNPLDSTNWTKSGVVIGSGSGGESGGASHGGIYIEAGALYAYYTTAAGNIDVCTASLDAPTVFTHVGTALTPPTGTTTPLANPFLLKMADNSYAFYFEANTTAPFWSTGRTVGTSPVGPFTDAVIPLPGLSPNPGKATTSNLHVIAEGDGYIGFFHSAWGENQLSAVRPTVGYMATSNDGLNWSVAGNGYPFVRMAHTAEVDQVADFFPVEVNGERYLFWSGNYATGSKGEIIGTRMQRPVSVATPSGQHQVAALARPAGSRLPRSWSKHVRLSANWTTTTTGSLVVVDDLSQVGLTFPDVTRLRFTLNGNIKTSVAGQMTVQLYLPSTTGVLTQSVAQTLANLTYGSAAAGAILPFSAEGVVDIAPGVPFDIQVRVQANATGTTFQLFSGAVLTITAEPL